MEYQIAGAAVLHCFFCLGLWSTQEVKLQSYYQLEIKDNIVLCILMKSNGFFLFSLGYTSFVARQIVYTVSTQCEKTVSVSGGSGLQCQISQSTSS